MDNILILIAAACLRHLVSQGIGAPIDAKIAELLPLAPRWACEAVTIFLAVVVVEALWLLAERALERRRNSADVDRRGSD